MNLGVLHGSGLHLIMALLLLSLISRLISDVDLFVFDEHGCRPRVKRLIFEAPFFSSRVLKAMPDDALEAYSLIRPSICNMIMKSLRLELDNCYWYSTTDCQVRVAQ